MEFPRKWPFLGKEKIIKLAGVRGVIRKWQAQVKLLDIKIERQLHLCGVGPMKCQAHLLMLVWLL